MKSLLKILSLTTISLISLTGFASDRYQPFLSFSVDSEEMDTSISCNLLLPNEYAANPDKIYPVLYALHGLGSSVEGWVSNAALVEAVNSDYPTIVVTFSGGSYWYVDDPNNPLIQYKTFFFNDLMPYIESTFRAGRSQGMRAITGYSMGGFGAWHYMTERPDLFSSASAVAGAFRTVKGNNPEAKIREHAQNNIDLPPTQIRCGTADGLIATNRNMQALLSDLGYSSEIIEEPGAGHLYWGTQAAEMLIWHYSHYESSAPTWRNFPLVDNSVNTPLLGWINITSDPWGWAYNLNQWVFLPDELDLDTGGWLYIRK